MPIRRLPCNVIEKIASSSAIVSLNGAVCGLVRNSLDAGAGRVNITLDYARGNCTVEDDGQGISGEEFGAERNLAKPNSSSRFPLSSNYHGRHGNFLASLAALSLLIITSKTGEADLHSSVAIHRGDAISRESTTPAQRCEFRNGTRVAVFDLFGSMPVRVKHRVSMFSGSSYLEKEFQALTYDLAALLLAWPTSLSLSLREARPDCQLRMRSFGGLALDLRASRLFMQAGLSDSVEAGAWVPVSAFDCSISVEGCISTVPVATRKSQFISLGIRPVEHSTEGNILFDEVNEIFTSSSFGLIESTGPDEASTNGHIPARWKPKRGLEKWPMFYLRFECNHVEGEDILRPHSPTLATLVSLLRAVCYAFLRKHKMRPRKQLHSRRTYSPLKGNGRSSFIRHDHDNQARASAQVAFGNSSSLSKDDLRVKVGHRANVTLPQILNGRHLIGSGGQLLQAPFVEKAGELCRDTDDCTLEAGSTKTCETLETHCQESKDRWLDKLIQSWRNPVFQTAEPAMHELPTELEIKCCKDTTRHSASTVTISGQISKQSLKTAEIIAQLDGKFVLIKLPLATAPCSNPSRLNQAQYSLFAVDQHAADERCRLEELMACYFEPTEGKLIPVVEPLDQYLFFDISSKEVHMFAKRQSYWGSWGISYQLPDVDSEGQGEEPLARIMVTGLPPSILERCRGEPRVLLDLLRRDMWDVEDNALLVAAKPAPNSNFHGCPSGILELLHSRACRSAIMFNDELTLAECTSLIRRLAQCSLPFQCAHGRPSMAPLVDLGSKTDGAIRSLPGTAFEENNAVPVLPDVNTWRAWMS